MTIHPSLCRTSRRLRRLTISAREGALIRKSLVRLQERRARRTGFSPSFDNFRSRILNILTPVHRFTRPESPICVKYTNHASWRKTGEPDQQARHLRQTPAPDTCARHLCQTPKPDRLWIIKRDVIRASVVIPMSGKRQLSYGKRIFSTSRLNTSMSAVPPVANMLDPNYICSTRALLAWRERLLPSSDGRGVRVLSVCAARRSNQIGLETIMISNPSVPNEFLTGIGRREQ